MFGGRPYFAAFDNASEQGRASWVYDPVSGPRILAEIWPGSGIDEAPWRATELDGRLYFDADDGIHGRELWVHGPRRSG